MSKKQTKQPDPPRRQTWEIRRDLLARFDIETVNQALITEVEDSKEFEASLINDDGAEAQIMYLIDEASRKEEELIAIIEEFIREDG
jgi:hypothetical protein